MLFTLEWVSTIFTKTKGKWKEGSSIQEVTTDSRSKSNHSLFVPLTGDNFDGHVFVEQAIDNGAIAVIWEESKALPSCIPEDFPVFLVKDTLIGLQALAKNYRDDIQPKVIGITGSNGKTTTKDLVTSILKTSYRVHATKGNFNNHIGLPLTILSMPRDTEILILEMGMSDFNEIDLLSKIAQPSYGIITNIGESHLEYLGSRLGIAQAKLEILNGMKDDSLLIIDGDEQLLTLNQPHSNILTCGYESANNVVIESVEIRHQDTIFQVMNQVYHVPLLGRHHAKNAVYAIMLAKELHVSEKDIQEGLMNVQSSGMRFELLEGNNGVSIINDAYNASPTSMKAAIEVVKEMAGFEERVLILGDIFELGKQADELHAAIAEEIESPITAVYTYGKLAKNITERLKTINTTIKCKHINTEKELIAELQQHLKENSLLLFKASRGMQFESFVEAIQTAH